MESVWSKSVNFKKREALNKDIECEVAVIGAGITGILIGYVLQKDNKDVVIIEGKTICSGNTKNTTAKITSQHDVIYNKLIKEFGVERARQYAQGNEAAIKEYKKIIEEEDIDCDFEEKDAYVYSLESNDELIAEYEAVKKLGIDAELTNKVKLPFDVKTSLKFRNQAQFNPLKFLSQLSEKLKIYENTMAIDIKDNIVITDKGEIKAKYIVVATQFPFLNMPGYYFMRMHQDRSYVIALENADNVDGMYIDLNKKGYSFRNYKDLLLLGGESQRTGENENGGAYDAIRRFAKSIYPNAKEKYHWSAQDCIPIDNIPYIGLYSKSLENVYVATGFKKWGMTTSMLSAMIIRDMILGKENEFAEIFSPTRFDMTASMKNAANDLAITAKNFIAQKVSIPEEHLEDIEEGYGKIIELNGDKIGVYKDNDGKVYYVTTKCPHLGCELKWNEDELSWDCPCHGSRFNYKGEWIQGPATKPLK